jgi:hypothetical protein
VKDDATKRSKAESGSGPSQIPIELRITKLEIEMSYLAGNIVEKKFLANMDRLTDEIDRLSKVRHPKLIPVFRATALAASVLSSMKLTSRPPGSRFLSIVDFLYSPKTVELTFQPIIADLRKEYFDSLQENRWIKAKWIRVRYFFLFLASMGLTKLWSLFSAIKQVIK